MNCGSKSRMSVSHHAIRSPVDTWSDFHSASPLPWPWPWSARTEDASITVAPASRATRGGGVGGVVVDDEELVDEADPVHQPRADGLHDRLRRCAASLRAGRHTDTVVAPRALGQLGRVEAPSLEERDAGAHRDQPTEHRARSGKQAARSGTLPSGSGAGHAGSLPPGTSTRSTSHHGRHRPRPDHPAHAHRGRLRGRRRRCHRRRRARRPRGRPPGLQVRALLDDDGNLRRFVNVFVADDDVRFLDGLSTKVAEGDTVAIIPAVAGG